MQLELLGLIYMETLVWDLRVGWLEAKIDNVISYDGNLDGGINATTMHNWCDNLGYGRVCARHLFMSHVSFIKLKFFVYMIKINFL